MSEITKELIEALKDALGFLEAVCFNTPNPKKRKDYADAASRSRAAIAKAEATLAAPQPADDGWIPWEGGECPVAHGTVVDVRLRNQGEGRAVASNWRGLHQTRGNSILKGTDIVAYRVVKS